jgi:hypothetical protein
MATASASSLAEDDKVFAEKFINTSHQKPRYKLFNFTYTLKRNNKKDSLYRCDFAQCNASITIDHNAQVIKVSGVNVSKKFSLEDIEITHKHPASELEIIRKQFEHNLISRSTTETLPLPKIHQQEESKMYKLASQKGFTDEEISKTLKTFHSKRGAMYNAKHINYPPIPKSLDELVIDGDLWTKCENGKDRFLIKDIKELDPKTNKIMRIIIFGSDVLLKVLCDGHLITADGTFDFAADLFYQVYILMSYFQYKMFPCVYTLMNTKTQVAYTRMLNEIRLACMNIQLSFNPKIVMTDFEIGAIGAFKEIWVDTLKQILEMLGCFFHFGNCLYKKLCDVGLRQEYIERVQFMQKLKNGQIIFLILGFPMERMAL